MPRSAQDRGQEPGTEFRFLVLAPRRKLDHNDPVTDGVSRGRRHSMRVPFGMPVEVLTQPEGTSAEVMNISQKGFFLRANASAPRDSLKLTTGLPKARQVYLVLQFRGEEQASRARGAVAWKSDLGVGINFEDPPERLRDFISDLQDSGATPELLSQVENGRVELA